MAANTHKSRCEGFQNIQKKMRTVFARALGHGLRLICAFEIGSDSDSRLGLNFGDAVLMYFKLLVKVEFGLPSAPDLEVH